MYDPQLSLQSKLKFPAFNSVPLMVTLSFAMPLLSLSCSPSGESTAQSPGTSATISSAVANPVQAIEAAQKSALEKPTYDNYITLSQAYYNNRQFPECIGATEKALAINPKGAIAYNNMGAAYNSLKMWDKGIEACSKAVAIAPTFTLAKNNLAWAKSQKAKGAASGPATLPNPAISR